MTLYRTIAVRDFGNVKDLPEVLVESEGCQESLTDTHLSEILGLLQKYVLW